VAGKSVYPFRLKTQRTLAGGGLGEGDHLIEKEKKKVTNRELSSRSRSAETGSKKKRHQTSDSKVNKRTSEGKESNRAVLCDYILPASDRSGHVVPISGRKREKRRHRNVNERPPSARPRSTSKKSIDKGGIRPTNRAKLEKKKRKSRSLE